MLTQIAPPAKQQFFDNSGLPLAGGLIYTYAAGTLNLQATYTDATGTTKNTNPVVLDGAGRANIWVMPAMFYKFVVQDSAGNTLYTTDNITGAYAALNTTLPATIQVPDGSTDAVVISRVTQSTNPVTIRTSDNLSDLRLQAGPDNTLAAAFIDIKSNGGLLNGSITLSTNQANTIVFDNIGNVGLQGAASTHWQGGGNIQSNNFVWSGWDQSIGYNYVVSTTSATSYSAITTDYASRYAPFAGNHLWYQSAGSTTAGSDISWIQQMRLNNAGYLYVGQSTAADSNTVVIAPNATGSTFGHQTGTTNAVPYINYTYGGTAIGSVIQYTTNSVGLTGVGNITFSDGTQQGTAAAAPTGDYRNKLINGAFNINQLGANNYYLTQSTIGYPNSGSLKNVWYINDRWLNTVSWGSTAGGFPSSGPGSLITYGAGPNAFTVGQTAVPGEPQYYYAFGITSSVGSSTASGTGVMVAMEQRVESVRTLAGQTVTVSFYAQATVAHTYAVILSQNFGSGGSASVGVGSYINVTTSWAKYTVTLTLPSISGKTIGTGDYLALAIVASKNDNTAYGDTLGQFGLAGYPSNQNPVQCVLNIATVQLEAGSAATAFEWRPIGMELSLAQRYLPVASTIASSPLGSGFFNLAAACEIFTPFTTAPRVPPTGVSCPATGITIETGTGSALTTLTSTSVSLGQANYRGAELYCGTGAGSAAGNYAYGRAANTTPIYFTGCEL